MRNKKHFIKKSVVLGITAISLVVATLITDASSALAAKTQTAGDYKVTKFEIPEYYDGNLEIFKTENKEIAAVIKSEKRDSRGRIVFDKKRDSILESYKITWSDTGKVKKTKIAKASGYRVKTDGKGRMFCFLQKKEKKITVNHLYVYDGKRKKIGEINISENRMYHLEESERDTNNSTGIVDFEVKGKYIDILMTEFRKNNNYEKLYSLQRFNWKNGKFVKAYRLDYMFDRIVDGKLYGGAGELDDEYAVKPIKEGYYVYNKSGKKCLYHKEIDYSYMYDVVGDTIIYKDENGIYALDISEDAEPELLISTKEFPLFKKYSNWIDIYAMSEDQFYIFYSAGEYYHGWDETQVIYKFKKK